MPLTRKGANSPLRAARSHSTVSVKVVTPAVKTKQGRKSSLEKETEVEQNLDFDGQFGKFEKITKRDNKSIHIKTEDDTKKTDSVAESSVAIGLNQNIEKMESSQLDVPALQRTRKRKLSLEVSNEESVKKLKVPTDNVSPRRSSRAVVPNSRYKDMEVMEVTRRKSTTAVSTDSEKKLIPKHVKEKVKDLNVPGINVVVEPDSKSNIVSEEIITYDTQIDEDLQMNMMDDLLVLPQTTNLGLSLNVENDEASGNGVNVEDETIHSNKMEEVLDSGKPESIDSSGVEDISLVEKREDQLQSDVSPGSSGLSKKIIVKEIKTSGQKVNITPTSKMLVISSESVKPSFSETEASNSVLDQNKEDSGEILLSPQVLTVPEGVTVRHPAPIPVPVQVREITGTQKSKQKIVVVDPKEYLKANSIYKKQQLPDKGKVKIITSAGVSKKNTGRIIEVLSKVTGKTGSMVIHTPPKGIDPTEVREFASIDKGSSSEPVPVEGLSHDSGNRVKSVSSTGIKPTGSQSQVNIVYVKVKQKSTDFPDEEISSIDQANNLIETGEIESQETVVSEEFDILPSQNELDNNIASGLLTNGQSDRLSEVTKETLADITEDQPKVLHTGEVAFDNSAIPDNDNEIADGPKQNGKVCEVLKPDKETESSPQVAIEYVVFGDRIVPIHKPFSQTNAGVYKKRSAPHQSSSLKKIPAKVAQTAISSLLEGIDKHNRPPNAAFTIDTEEPVEMEEETPKGPNVVKQSVILIENSDQKTEGQTVAETTTDTVQPKPGRVIHGYIDKADVITGPTEIVEISQDLFTKEVYGEPTVLDPVTGQMVTESMLTDTDSSDKLTNTTADASHPATDDGHELDNQEELSETVNELTKTASTEQSESSGNTMDTEYIANKADDTGPSSEAAGLGTDLSTVKTSGPGLNPMFSIENLSEGESVILQIDKNGVVLSEMLGYKAVTDVKINPAMPVVSTATAGSKELKSVKSTSSSCIQIKPVRAGTSNDKHREIETQTDDIDDEEDSVEEGKQVVLTGESTTKSTVKPIVIVNSEDTVRRTTVMMEENGQLQEYVVVHLPEGAEIKQQDVKQNVNDPIHNEVVTMSDDGMYICVDCNHKTDKRGNWYKHRRKHLGIRPHSCTQCSYKAATSSNLKRHMQIHNDVRNYECTLCGLCFRQKIHLERHVKYKHQEKKVKCPLCDYLCSSENPDLKIHIRRRHMPQEDGSMSAFTCSECGLMTVSKKDLKQHMKFHKKGPELKLFCEYCSFVTDCESRLRRHMLIHTKEKPFQCGLCSYRATQKEHVLRHMKTQHDVEVERKPRRSLLSTTNKPKQKRSLLDDSGQPAYNETEQPAEVSTEKLYEKSDYSSTDKIFACNHCTMKFSKLINLYKHLFAQHKQIMPETNTTFQCVVCEFRTNNKKNLLVHMRKHNMHDHSPPTHVYSCVLCRYINPRRRNLFQHMKKKHGIEIMMRDDGYNCYVTGDVVVGQQDGEQGIMALSEIVTTHPLVDESQLQIITEDGASVYAEKISLDDIMSTEVINTYESSSSQEQGISTQITTLPSTPLYQSSIAEHEAAEAIEGLQALAEQAAGVVETQTIDPEITTEIITSDIMAEGEIMTAGEETLVEQNREDDGIELSSEQLNQLSAGDFVEINGEVYKVEIAPENTPKIALS